VADQVREEPRDQEKQLHRERVRGEEEPVEKLVGGHIRDGRASCEGNEAPGRMEDDDDKERESPRGIEGVKTFGLS
jgi:hypothetical protein